MANPGLGQFAGSFANSFFQAIQANKDNEARAKLAKMQAKVFEMQLAKGELQLDAQTKVADIMTGTRTQLELGGIDEEGLGTFRPTGANVESPNDPQGLADMLTNNPKGQLAALQSGMVSGGDILDFQSEQNRLSAVPDINAILEKIGSDDQGNPRLILGPISFDPVKGPTPTLIPNPEFNTRRQKEFSRLGMRELTDSALEAVGIMSEQAGSLLESGFPFGEQARTGQSIFATVGGVLGFDTKKQKAAVAKRERLDKLFGLILNTRLERLMETDPNLSVTQIQQQMDISPDTEKRAEANILLMADFIQEELNRADINEISMSAEDRKKSLDFIRKARSGEFLQSETKPLLDIPAIAKATKEQIESMDIENATTEQVVAIRKRLKELR